MGPLRLLLLLPFFFLLSSCQEQTTLTGHQEIASVVRDFLDQSYAGIDYPSYRDDLKKVKAVVVAQLPDTPAQLRDQIRQMLAYLRTAEEVLRWQDEENRGSPEAQDRTVVTWIEHHPFLQAAVGARAEAPGAFDSETALTLLWDKTDEILRGLQVKNRPL